MVWLELNSKHRLLHLLYVKGLKKKGELAFLAASRPLCITLLKLFIN